MKWPFDKTPLSEISKAVIRIDRATILLLIGTAICLVAGLYPWFRVPSSALSWLDSRQLLHIVAVENPFSIATRVSLLAFAFLAALGFAFPAQYVRALRYVAWIVLCCYLLAPQWIINWSPEDLKDSQIIYNHVDRVVTDMELNLIHQQTDWRSNQSFRSIARDRGSLIEEPAFESWSLDLLAWGGQEEVFDQILGLSNSFLNLTTRGWYGALVGLSIWLTGVYDRTRTSQIRYRDYRFVSLLALGMLLLSIAPRAMAEFEDRQLESNSASGDYISATRNLQDASLWTALRKYSIGYQARAGAMAEQLECSNCPSALIAEANFALLRRDYLAASSLLDRVPESSSRYPGLRYWRGLAHAGLAFDLFNIGQYSAADHEFAIALEFVPIDALAWYGRSITQLRMRDEQRAAEFLEQVVIIQGHLNFKRLTIQAQWHVMKSWEALRSGRLDEAHAEYRMQLSPESW